MKSRKSILVLALAALASLILAGPAASQADVVFLSADMTGATQDPPGDPDGSGEASFILDATEEEVCYTLTARNIAEPDDAHIHLAATGDVVVDLDEPDPRVSSDCENIDAAVANDIAENPADYSVNVHNDPFPDGAIGGTLARR